MSVDDAFEYEKDSADYLRGLRNFNFKADDPEIEELLESADEAYVEHLVSFGEESEYWFSEFERYMDSVSTVLQLNKESHLDYDEFLEE